MSENSLCEPRAPSQMPARIGYIDSLKGFAILCVVLNHVLDGYTQAGLYPDHPSMPILLTVVVYFHMPLFMLVSGYLFRTAYFDAHGQLQKRRMYRHLLNLILVYIGYDIAFGLFKLACRRYTNVSVSLADVLLFPIRPIHPYWYLYILIFYYIIFSRGPVLRHHKAVFYVTAVSALLSAFVSFDFFEFHNILYYALFFWIGFCYRQGAAAWFGSPVVTAILFTFSIVVAGLNLSGFLTLGDIPGLAILLSLGLAQGLWYAFAHLNVLRDNRLFSIFGKYSLEIYLIHSIFTAGARTVFPSFILDHYLLSVVLNFMLSSSIPVLFAFLCKRLSIHDFLFRPAVFLERVTKGFTPPQ